MKKSACSARNDSGVWARGYATAPDPVPEMLGAGGTSPPRPPEEEGGWPKKAAATKEE